MFIYVNVDINVDINVHVYVQVYVHIHFQGKLCPPLFVRSMALTADAQLLKQCGLAA